ncbi:MAG: dTDP-4-dehydrorhamnose reductase [Eubacterium sp.]|nr:dTDP-4-dehydrorhamnose reductase [Eubacterium sp.]
MKVLVTGVKGQLGFDVVNELKKRGHQAVGVDIEEMDITDEQSVSTVLHQEKPEVVVHCAAWTAVDAAEDEENIPKVMQVNAQGTENIAKVCKELDAKMIYISTDYVFDGQGDTPWKPDDERAPLNVYGESKYRGEVAVQKYLEEYYIVRIAWVFGYNGKNFVKTMLNLGKTHDALTVVSDQIGTPTYTYDLARLLVDMAEKEKYGIYHATNEGGFISWYDFTVEIMKQASAYDEIYGKVKVSPVGSEMYPAKAKRPANSRMDKSKLVKNGFEPLPTWQNALERYLQQIME